MHGLLLIKQLMPFQEIDENFFENGHVFCRHRLVDSHTKTSPINIYVFKCLNCGILRCGRNLSEHKLYKVFLTLDERPEYPHTCYELNYELSCIEIIIKNIIQ